MASLVLGGASRRGNGSLAVGARSRSVGAKSSFQPSFNGLVSVNAASVASGKRTAGPPVSLPKASYAEQLDAQVAAKEAERAKYEAWLREPSKEAPERSMLPRSMGHRLGGPMAPVSKEAYAAELRNQMAERLEKREACQAVEEFHETPLLADAAEADVAAAAMQGKRCVFADAPTRDSYANVLKEQMASQGVRRADEHSARLGPRVEECEIKGAAAIGGASEEFAKGKRLTGPMEAPSKEAYAEELKKQMYIRSVQQTRERAASEDPMGLGIEGVTHARGRRHESRLKPQSTESYMAALKEQMAERAASRAANAFHKQADGDAPSSGVAHVLRIGESEASRQQVAGRRQLAAAPRSSKQEYAAELHDQVIARNMRQEAQWMADAAPHPGMFRAESSEAAARGRRHEDVMAAPSKESLASALQAQMAERDAKRAADLSQARAPDALLTGNAVVPQGGVAAPHGKRHVAPPSPITKDRYAAALQDQIVERDDMRGTGGLPLPSGASRPPLPPHFPQRGSPQQEAPHYPQRGQPPAHEVVLPPHFPQRGPPQQDALSREVPRAQALAEPSSPTQATGLGASGRFATTLSAAPGGFSSSLGRTGASLMGMTNRATMGTVRFADEVADGHLEEQATFSPEELEQFSVSRQPRAGGNAYGAAALGRGPAARGHSDSLERLLGEHAALAAAAAR